MGIAKNNQTLKFFKDNNTTHNRMKTSILRMILMKIFKTPQTAKGYWEKLKANLNKHSWTGPLTVSKSQLIPNWALNLKSSKFEFLLEISRRFQNFRTEFLLWRLKCWFYSIHGTTKGHQQPSKNLEHIWRTYPPDIKTFHKTKRIKSIILVQEEKNQPTEQNKDLRHRPTLMWSHDLWQRCY